MKNKKENPYATNKAGLIRTPKNPAESDPKATRRVGTDLRIKQR